jgi:hypothetical protein
MKLLIYLHSLEAGGAERVAATLANHWAARGWALRYRAARSCKEM